MASQNLKWYADVAFDRLITFGRVKIRLYMRKGNGVMGRLGGGWVWKLGVLAAKSEFVLELFVMSVRVSWRKH